MQLTKSSIHVAVDPSPLDDGRASETVADDSFISCALASAVGGGGPGLGELEEAAANLLGVQHLEDIYPLLDGGRGRAGANSETMVKASAWTAAAAPGLRLRVSGVALGEDAGRCNRLHEAAHDGVARALRRRPDAERREQRLRGLRAGGRWGGVGGSLGGRGLGALGRGVGGVLRHGCGKGEICLWRGEGDERDDHRTRVCCGVWGETCRRGFVWFGYGSRKLSKFFF